MMMLMKITDCYYMFNKMHLRVDTPDMWQMFPHLAEKITKEQWSRIVS